MRIATFAVFAGLLLSGCISDTEKGLCPTAAVLAPTSAMTVFRENAPADPSGELYTVWMTNVKSSCDFDKDNKTTDSKLRIMFGAKRAPTGEAASYRVPYFVTVTRGGNRIMTKKMYLADVAFLAGANGDLVRAGDRIRSPSSRKGARRSASTRSSPACN